jgi:hypothetical protein
VGRWRDIGTQQRALLGFAGLVALLVLGLTLAGQDPFTRFLGPVPPLVAVAGAALAGVLALGALERVGLDPTAPTARTALGIAGVSAAFPLPMIVADCIAPFPRDLNIPLPWALLFYPAIALVAEVVFHLVPLALGWSLIRDRLPWWVLGVAVAAIEPVYQVVLGDGHPVRDPVMVVSLVAFGSFQLSVLRRHGVAALFGTRIAYYAVWHLLWGALRLVLVVPVKEM